MTFFHSRFDNHERAGFTPVGTACLCLSLWGCIAIYNATCHLVPAYVFVERQLVWIGVGGLALALASRRDATFYRCCVATAGPLVYAALWLVLACGVRVNGMRGWFAWRGIFLQPSELAKPIFVLCLALWLENLPAERRQSLRGYLPGLALLALWILPIALQPDFGTLLVYVFTFVALYWCMGGAGRHLVWTAAAATPLAGLALYRYPYAMRRVAAFLDPDAYAQTSGWHIIQFRRCLAAGGLFGNPAVAAEQTAAVLPLGYSDSIFASTAAAVGFVGVLPIVVITLAWVAYGYLRAARSHDTFSRAAILGMVALLAGQAFAHLSVNLGLLPPTGITLPLISYGGSSLVASLTMVGIVEGIARSN